MRRYVKKHVAGRDTIIRQGHNALGHHTRIDDPSVVSLLSACMCVCVYCFSCFLMPEDRLCQAGLRYREARWLLFRLFFQAWRVVTSENCEAVVHRIVRRLHWKRPIVPIRRTPGCRYTRAILPSTDACSTRCSGRSTWYPNDSRPHTDCMYSPELSGRQRH